MAEGGHVTRKDFRLLAAALKASKPSNTHGMSYRQWRLDVAHVGAALKADNPAVFDTDKFAADCGLELTNG